MVLFAAASLLAVFSLPCFRPLLFSTDNVDACEKGSSSSACTCAAPSSLVVCLALVLFMLVDVTYFLRTFAMGLWLRFTAERHSKPLHRPSAHAWHPNFKLVEPSPTPHPLPQGLLSEVTTNSVVWLTDIDFMQHMNNSKYLRAMDFARFKLWISNGVWGHLRSLRATMVLGAVSVRYRKSLNLLERFSIKLGLFVWERPENLLQEPL